MDELRSKVSAVRAGSEDTLAETARLAIILEDHSAQDSLHHGLLDTLAAEDKDLGTCDEIDIASEHLDASDIDFSLDFTLPSDADPKPSATSLVTIAVVNTMPLPFSIVACPTAISGPCQPCEASALQSVDEPMCQ